MQPSNDNHSQPSINNESVTACPTNNDPIYISDIDSSPSSSTGRVGIKTCQAKDKMSSFKYNNDLYIIDSDDDESDSDLPSVGHLFGTKSHSNNNYESPATNEHCNEDLLPSPLLAYNNTSIINTSQSNEVSPKLTSKQLVPSPQLQPTNTSISCIGTCPSNEVTVINSDSDSDSDILPLAERIGISVVSSDNSKKIYPHKPVGVNSTCKPVTRPSNQPSVTIPANTITNNTLLHIPTSASSQKEATTRLEQPLVLSITTHTTTATKSVAGRSSQKDPIELSLQKSLVTLRPGEFEVVLCIDNTESTASRKSTSHFRGLLLEELNKNGVKFSVRKLNVGDFLWIARENVKISSRDQLREPDAKEIVLEHIIERKRMDDLADSIIDKRFNEQKFRMKNSGLYNPIYLIEEHGDIGHSKISELALRQAVTNTQILDEFYIKEAKDIRESVAYLTIMTRYIQRRYSKYVIKGYTVDTMVELNKKRRNGNITLEDGLIPGIPFTLFNKSSVKTKVSTVTEMFGRHLIQIPNSSSEKAAAIIEVYPTVSHLREAYSNCSTERERDNLLTPLRAGECKRRFGPILSAFIRQLYWRTATS